MLFITILKAEYYVCLLLYHQPSLNICFQKKIFSFVKIIFFLLLYVLITLRFKIAFSYMKEYVSNEF